MARRLIWSARAEADLSEILAYIGTHSPENARRVARRIVARTESLPDQPGQVRRLPESGVPPDLREVIVQRWRVVYRADEAEVIIVAVIDGARLLRNVPPLGGT